MCGIWTTEKQLIYVNVKYRIKWIMDYKCIHPYHLSCVSENTTTTNGKRFTSIFTVATPRHRKKTHLKPSDNWTVLSLKQCE